VVTDAARKGFTSVRLAAAVALWAFSWPLGWFLGGEEGDLLPAIWPSVTALGVVFLTRRALAGLVAGAVAGAIILTRGDPWQAYVSLAGEHFAPHFSSEWKLSAVAFTLMLGGFAAVLERSGGLEYFLKRFLLRQGEDPRRLQGSAAILGLICFFDGLANSVLVGRIVSPLAERHGVSRVKLAYIADSTSSAVACVAFLSTWIAYQLSMIREGFAQIGVETNPYGWFLRSLPFNFYCWFTLLMVGLVIWRNFNPGAMAAFEREARAKLGAADSPAASGETAAPARAGGLLVCVAGLATLFAALIGGLYGYGLPSADPGASYFPVNAAKLTAAFGSSAGAFVLVFGGTLASVAVLALFPASGRSYSEGVRAYGDGVKHLLAPVTILIGAWMLSSTLAALKTGDLLSGLVGAWAPLALIPLFIFLFGALISFSTGTSWGTMGILMPLAIPLIAGHPGAADVDLTPFYAAAVGAVFSGAVFGDHCSPISDTTLVSSIVCEVSPHDHVRTQAPMALMSAGAAALLGFLPAGLGMPPWAGLALGTVFLGAIACVARREA